MGMAKPSPIEPPSVWEFLSPIVAIAEFTPIRSPFMSTSAPPEFPGLIAASVWMASSTVFWLPVSPTDDTGRLSALMMPLVTVLSKPRGDPTATTLWPTCRLADDPMLIGVRPDTSFARTPVMERGDGLRSRYPVRPRVGERDHMIVRHYQTVGIEDDARTLRDRAAQFGLQLHHTRHDLGGHLLDRSLFGPLRRRRAIHRDCRDPAGERMMRLDHHGGDSADRGRRDR